MFQGNSPHPAAGIRFQQASQPTFTDFQIIDDLDDASDDTTRSGKQPWLILIADDEEEVHQTTVFSLKGVEILGRPLEFLHVYDSDGVLTALQEHDDIAVVLLDVVMESHDAGLKVVETIRALGYQELRIVLRTGQPGYAPELSVLRDYDINDYRSKTELTQQRLISVLMSSLRSYRQLSTINKSRLGLQQVIESSKDLFKRKSMNLFANGVLNQLIALAGEHHCSGVVCRTDQPGSAAGGDEASKAILMLTASGRFKELEGQKVALEALEAPLVAAFKRALSASPEVVAENYLAACFTALSGCQLFIYLDQCAEDYEEQLDLLKLFAGNIAVGFENLELIERLDHLAYFDPVLQLPNLNALTQEYNRRRLSYAAPSLMVIHLNALGQLIGVFGLLTVNRALIEVHRQLQDFFANQQAFIATDGKSDFFVLCEYAPAAVNKIRALFTHKISVNGMTLPLSCTIGQVRLSPEMGIDSGYRCVASALLEAKKVPGGTALEYDHAMSGRLAKRISLQADLRKALQEKTDIAMYLQPKVDCKTGQIVGAEALCRWFRAGEPVSPAKFIPLAEASGMSEDITNHMLACIGRFFSSRSQGGLPPLPIALNQSMIEVNAPDYAAKLHQKLVDYGLPPELVEIEMTESAMMMNPELIIHELNSLRAHGYSIAIDDFGTGYSSLSVLNRLPANVLKLDKSFIDRIETDTSVNALVATTISLASQLGLKVVAEGVETEAQFETLKAMGCDLCQGYYFGKPTPAEEFDATFQHRFRAPH